MKSATNALPVVAAGISLLAHLTFVLLVPYRAPRIAEPPARELIPIRFLEVSPRPRARESGRSSPPPVTPAARTTIDARESQEIPAPAEPVAVEQSPLPAESPPADRNVLVSRPPENAPLDEGVLAEPQVPAAEEPVVAAEAPPDVQPSAEIAAYQLILSTLRSRIVESIRYPAIARANGWEGKVIVAVRLDARGKLEQAVVRRSSGHEVLDRAAVALLKRVTPVTNLLALPITIETTITYTLE
jgi:protein TonB